MAGDGCGNYYVLASGGRIGFVDTMANPDALDGEQFPDLFECAVSLLENEKAGRP